MKTEEVDKQVPTSDGVSARVRAAWSEAAPTTRRAFAVAFLASVVIAGSMPMPIRDRVGAALIGVLFALAALVDVHEQRLPNALLGGAAVVAVVLAVASTDGSIVVGSVAGGAVGVGCLLVVRLARGVGMGDVKMAGSMGLGLGVMSPSATPIAVAVAAFAAASYGAVMRRRRLVLGPSLWLGWVVALGAFCRWS